MDGSIGLPVVRRDAAAKAAGAAQYAADFPHAGAAYAALTTSAVARGRITRMDTSAAEAVPGVQTGADPSQPERGAGRGDVRHEGRAHAVLLPAADLRRGALRRADRGPDRGRHAGGGRGGFPQGRIDYATQPASAAMDDPGARKSRRGEGHRCRRRRGRLRRGAGQGGLHVSTPRRSTTTRSSCRPRRRPGATASCWSMRLASGWWASRRAGGDLRHPDGGRARRVPVYRRRLRRQGDDPAAHRAGRDGGARLGRPVKLVVPREAMFTVGSFRPATRSRVRLAAERDGTLTAVMHEQAGQSARSTTWRSP